MTVLFCNKLNSICMSPENPLDRSLLQFQLINLCWTGQKINVRPKKSVNLVFKLNTYENNDGKVSYKYCIIYFQSRHLQTQNFLNRLVCPTLSRLGNRLFTDVNDSVIATVALNRSYCTPEPLPIISSWYYCNITNKKSSNRSCY